MMSNFHRGSRRDWETRKGRAGRDNLFGFGSVMWMWMCQRGIQERSEERPGVRFLWRGGVAWAVMNADRVMMEGSPREMLKRSKMCVEHK